MEIGRRILKSSKNLSYDRVGVGINTRCTEKQRRNGHTKEETLTIYCKKTTREQTFSAKLIREEKRKGCTLEQRKFSKKDNLGKEEVILV